MSNSKAPSPQPPYTLSPRTQALINHLIADINIQITHAYIALFPRLRTRFRSRLLVLPDRYNILAGVTTSLFLRSFFVSRWVYDERRAYQLLINEDTLRFAIADYWQDHEEFIAVQAPVAEGVVM